MSRTPSVISSITAQQSVVSQIDPSRVAQLVLQLAERSKENSELHKTIRLLTTELADAKSKVLEEQRRVEELQRDVDALPGLVQKYEEYKERCKSLKKLRQEENDAKDQLIYDMKRSVESMDNELQSLRDQYRNDTGDITLKLRRMEAEYGEVLTDHEQLKVKYELLHRRKDDDVKYIEREKERSRLANVSAKGTQVEPSTSTKLMMTDDRQLRSIGEQCDLLVAGAATSRTLSGQQTRRSGGINRRAADIPDLDGSYHHPADSLSGILHQLPHLGIDQHRRDDSFAEAAGTSSLPPPAAGDDIRDEDVNQSELVHRYYMERQIKIHDKLLSAVTSLQREASKATRVPAPF